MIILVALIIIQFWIVGHTNLIRDDYLRSSHNHSKLDDYIFSSHNHLIGIIIIFRIIVQSSHNHPNLDELILRIIT